MVFWIFQTHILDMPGQLCFSSKVFLVFPVLFQHPLFCLTTQYLFQEQSTYHFLPGIENSQFFFLWFQCLKVLLYFISFFKFLYRKSSANAGVVFLLFFPGISLVDLLVALLPSVK